MTPAACEEVALSEMSVKSIEYTVRMTIDQFSAFAALEEWPKERYSVATDLSDLGCFDVDGQWFLSVSGVDCAKAAPLRQPTQYGVALCRTHSTKGCVIADVTLRIPNAGFEKRHVGVVVAPGDPAHTDSSIVFVGGQHWFSQSDLLDPARTFLKNDTLTVEAHVRVMVRVSAADTLEDKTGHSVLADLGAMLLSGAHTDFIVVAADGQEFPVHRCVLAARADAFAAMLKHKTKERESGRCAMTDMSGQTTAAFLDFIYTGSLKQVRPDTAEGLLVAADKYGFLDLEDACVECIIGGITTENAARLLILADQHSATKLKTAVICHIKAGLLPHFVQRGGLHQLQEYREGWRLVGEIMSAIS